MELTTEAVAAVFQSSDADMHSLEWGAKHCHAPRGDAPLNEAMRQILLERWSAFVETMMCEIECFEGEDNPWLEAEIIGGL